MVQSLFKFGLLTITLLAFVCQLAFANSQLMITNSNSVASQQTIDTKSDCHHEDSTPSAPCCEQHSHGNTVADNQTNSCCNSEKTCQGNCNHCVVVVFNATLLNDDIWLHHQQKTHRLIAMTSHFPSILLSQDFKPPIHSSIS